MRKCEKNIIELDRPQMTIWLMCIACRIPKTTNAHSEYVILIAFPWQHWFHERVSMLHYTCCMSYVYNELKMQVFSQNTALLFKKSATCFSHCFVAIIKLISRI